MGGGDRGQISRSELQLQADSDDDDLIEDSAPRAAFNIENETGARGAKPESNQILETEESLIQARKEKCLEVFRNNTDIRDLITDTQLNP